MMLIFIAIASAAYGRLIGLVEVCRQGSRAPLKLQSFDVNEWEASGELSPEGMRQHVLNGNLFRKRYIDEYKLLSPVYNSSEIYVRATDQNSTIQSAQSQLLGWYPDSGYTIYNDASKDLAVPPMQIDNVYNITQSLGYKALPFNYQPIPVNVFSNETDRLLLGQTPEICPRLGQIQQGYLSSYEFAKHVASYEEQYAPYVTRLLGHYVDIRTAVELTDNVMCDSFVGIPEYDEIPYHVYEFFEKIYNIKTFLHVQTDEGKNLAASEFFKTLIQNLNDTINETSSTKFYFYSGPDPPLASFLAAMRAPVKWLLPEFASTLLYELWEDDGEHLVTIKYNDTPMGIPGCNINCTFDEFSSVLQQYIVDDIEEACKLKNTTMEESEFSNAYSLF